MATTIVSEDVLIKKIKYFAVFSRLLTILMQIVFNAVLPDHEAGVFNPVRQSHTAPSAIDHVISFLLGGFQRWDALYYTHIAEHGYTFENTLAFFPLFPLFVRVTANTLLFPGKFLMSYTNVLLISATLINFVLFIKTAENLYKLGKIITGNDTVAYMAALLFCINPASVFMSACYTECVYAYLTFTGLLRLEEHKHLSASVLFAFSCLTRSNGLFNLGYLGYLLFKKGLQNFKSLWNAVSMKMEVIMTLPWIYLSTTLVPYSMLIVIGILPFIVYQYYCYKLFCEKEYTFDIPHYVVQYAKTEGLKLPTDEKSPWCTSSVPLAYRYVQTHYWDQGLFKYWQMKQIPNFLLATPVTVLVYSLAVTYFKHNRYVCLTLGLDEVGAAKKEAEKSGYYKLEGVKLLPYVLHTVLLTMFGVFCIHVQVLTRLLFSSTPILYWYTAYLLLGDVPRQTKYNPYDIWKSSYTQVEKKENLDRPWKNRLIDYISNFKRENVITKLLLVYFIGYCVIGVAMFSNFLPWT